MDLELKGKRIFITGGAGFIGSWLARSLAPANEVVLYDTLRRNAAADVLGDDYPNVQVVAGDVLDRSHMAEAAQGATHFIHLAAVAGIDTVTQSPTSTMMINLTGTAHACEVAHALPGLSRFVFFSTSEVYGPQCHQIDEEDSTTLGAPYEPRWVYAASKAAAEHLVMAWHREFGLPTVCIRPFNVYGPGQVGEGAIQVFVTRTLAGEPLHIRGDGRQVRAWLYIDDAVAGVLRALSMEAAVGQVFNLGNPDAAVTTLELADLVCDACGASARFSHVENPGADVLHRVPNVARARRLLDWSPRVGLKAGLDATVEWFVGAKSSHVVTSHSSPNCIVPASAHR